jgi:hypothetical protein
VHQLSLQQYFYSKSNRSVILSPRRHHHGLSLKKRHLAWAAHFVTQESPFRSISVHRIPQVHQRIQSELECPRPVLLKRSRFSITGPPLQLPKIDTSDAPSVRCFHFCFLCGGFHGDSITESVVPFPFGTSRSPYGGNDSRVHIYLAVILEKTWRTLPGIRSARFNDLVSCMIV